MLIRKTLTLLYLLLVFTCLYSQPQITWQKCFGGTSGETITSVTPTLDDGYICLGISSSNDFDLTGVCCPFGSSDIWILKLDSAFEIEWQRLFPFDNNPIDEMIEIFVETDTTYTMFGTIEGAGETVICDCNHSESQDIWKVTFDQEGEIISQKCYGGTSYDRINSVSKCEDGGYIIGGSSGSADGDVGNHYGSAFATDGFVIKIDKGGNIQWTKHLGGTGYDGAFTSGLSENRCFINLVTSSHDYDLEGIMPEDELSGRLFIITDSLGIIVQQNFLRTYDLALELNYVYEISGNRYVLLGTNEIDTGMFSGNHDGIDAAIGIFDTNLNFIDFIQYGGSEIDVFNKMVAINDAYYFFGYSYSSDFDCQNNYGESDGFIIKTDSMFAKIWSTSVGSSGIDRIIQLYPFPNELVVFGTSNVNAVNDGDILNAHFNEVTGENGEAWIILFDDETFLEDTIVQIYNIKIYPNPASDEVIVQFINFDNPELNLTIFYLDGKELLTTSLPLTTNHINTTNIPQGLYLFTITNSTKTIVKSDTIFIH